MASTLRELPLSPRREDESDLSLKERGLKARLVSRQNTGSRRFSASYIRSLREDATSFRSNITISSTASSPGYTLREEINPSTYSFTNALRALQARSANCWEILSPEGIALNSKWDEAEKYICNPLSGEVPMACLSARTLSNTSFRHLTGRITMSAPLVYSSLSRQACPKRSSLSPHEDQVHFPLEEKKVTRRTRDVGTQSTPPELSSSSPSPAPTPPIEERPMKREVLEDFPVSIIAKLNFKEKVEVKEIAEKGEETKSKVQKEKREKGKQMCSRCQQGGCLSWKGLWVSKRQREQSRPRKKNISISVHHVSGC